jgi:hypothetical protein
MIFENKSDRNTMYLVPTPTPWPLWHKGLSRSPIRCY